jgi:dienelactone hydrolase
MIANDWGFVAFAADIYGADLQVVENMTERVELATFYRSNPEVFGSRIHAAVEYVKTLDQVDAEKVALFGYCFGGTGVLQYGLNGNDDVEAIVSFHGGLSALPENPVTFGPKLLVLSGGDDDASTDIMDLEVTLDSVNASWEITRYSGIEHAFTVFSEGKFSKNEPRCCLRRQVTDNFSLQSDTMHGPI